MVLTSPWAGGLNRVITTAMIGYSGRVAGANRRHTFAPQANKYRMVGGGRVAREAPGCGEDEGIRHMEFGRTTDEARLAMVEWVPAMPSVAMAT